jgi:hypothetical protein
MYSAVTLLPEKDTGFVFMINGNGSTARTVLTQALVDRLTAATSRSVNAYANELMAEVRPETSKPSDVTARTAAQPDAMRSWLGVYRDPWFGEVSVCARQDRVEFAAAKSPLLKGALMRVADRMLVDWDDDSVDVEAWLDFSDQQGVSTLLMSKVDPAADFSFDYEDLRFSRAAACP